jgi:hypothetical protein
MGKSKENGIFEENQQDKPFMEISFGLSTCCFSFEDSCPLDILSSATDIIRLISFGSGLGTMSCVAGKGNPKGKIHM